MICIYAAAKVKPGCREPFLKEAQSLVNHSRAEAGNIRYELAREEENLYIFMELWHDDASLQAHIRSKHFLKAGEAFAYLLTEPLEIHKMDSVF